MSTENPFAEAAPTQGGPMVAIEADRAVAEVKAALVVARAHPRDKRAAMDRILAQCARPTLADAATYQYARGGTEISGASIKLAETMAREWGNLEAGVVELARENGVSDCLAYSWDLETNYREKRSFRVKHWRDTKRGGYALTDERDVYELIANMGARRKRACILAVIGDEVEQAALRACEKTLLQYAKVTPERIAEVLAKFSELGVTQAQIEKRIQRKIEAIQAKHIVQLGRIYNSLRDRMGEIADFFEVAEGAAPVSDLKSKLKAKAAAETKPPETEPAKPEEKPQDPKAEKAGGDAPKAKPEPRHFEMD